MSGRLINCVAIILGAVAHHGAIAGAQTRNSASLDSAAVFSRELVEALIGGYRAPGTPPPKIFYRALPDDFPRALVSAGSIELLGSVQYGVPPGRGSHATVIGIIKNDPDSALAALKRAWQSAGLREPSRGQNPGGFVPAPAIRPSMFCSDSSMLTAFMSPRAAGGNYLRLELTNGQGPTPCAMEAMRPRPTPTPDFTFPTLVAPPGAKSLNTSISGSVSGREASVLLETDMTPAQLISHYSAQLKSAGWTLDETATTRLGVFQIANGKDSNGRQIAGILSALSLPQPRSRSVSFKILSPETSGYSGPVMY